MKTFDKAINLGILVFLLLIISSCEDEIIHAPNVVIEDQEEPVPLSGEWLGLLDCLQFDTIGALESQDYVTVEGDIAIAKTELSRLTTSSYPGDQSSIEYIQLLLDEMDRDSLMVSPRQYVINDGTLISLSDVDEIRYYIHSSIDNIEGNNDWRNAIIAAMSDWANVSDCKISVEQVSSNSLADISFYSDNNCPLSCMNNLGPNVIAKANFPQSNNVGRYVSINNLSLTYSQKKWDMRHEIGHALGFRHNNSSPGEAVNSPNECGGPVNGLNLLSGTPANDSYSVMRTGSLFTFSLSANDKEAARYMYPDSYTIPVINLHSISLGNPNYVTLYVNSPNVDPYQVIVTRHSVSSSTIIQSNSFYSPNNDDTSFSVSCPSGTWRFKVWRKNFGSYSKVSAYRTVYVP